MPRVARLFSTVLVVVLAASTAGCATDSSVPGGARTEAASADTRPDPAAEVADAVADSTSDGRAVLLVLGDDGPRSEVLESALTRPRAVAATERGFHVVRVDVGTPAGREVAAANGVRLERSGTPALAVLLDGMPVYASNRGQFARPGRLTQPELVRWLHRWS